MPMTDPGACGLPSPCRCDPVEVARLDAEAERLRRRVRLRLTAARLGLPWPPPEPEEALDGPAIRRNVLRRSRRPEHG